MSILNIPAPTISTGPKHMTETEAAEHYLREMRDRTKMLQAGSGVTALVNRLLDDVLDAMEALNASTNTPTPERVTLTDEEQRTAAIVSYAAFWWSQETGETDEWDDLDANEREAVTENSYAETAVDWFAAREQALREEIGKPHAYGVEVLVNAGRPSAYWALATEEEFGDTVESAEDVRDMMLAEGYRLDHLRIVALTVVRGGAR